MNENLQRWSKENLIRYAMQGAFLGVLATVIVFLVTQKPETFEQLRNFRWDVAAGLFVMVAIAWVCNGLRVMILSRALGYPLTLQQGLSTSLSCEFGITATPGGIGGTLIRLGLLKRAGVKIAHGTSMLTIDVSMDVIYFTILLPFAIYSLINNEPIYDFFSKNLSSHGLNSLLYISWILIVIVIMKSMGSFRFLSRQLARWKWFQRYRIGARGRWIRWKIVSGWHHFKQGLYHILSLKKGSVLLAFLLCSIQWTCRYSVLPIVLYAFSITNDPIPLFFLQGLLFMFSLMIVLPGGGGGVEVTMAVILSQLYPVSVVAVVVLIWRFFTYHLYMLGGGIMFFYTCARMNKIFPQSSKPCGELPIEEFDPFEKFK